MIEQPLTPAGPVAPGQGPQVDLPPATTITPQEDGSVIVEYAEAQTEADNTPFDANLAALVEPGELSALGSELVSYFEEDKRSREDWEKAYIKGLKLLGFQLDERTEPWLGACGVYHPVLSEAVVRFQSQAIMELFPPAGPVRTRIIGQVDDNREAQAKRVEEYLNYMLTVRMREYRAEHEQMLFYLALAGSAFKKVYQDYSLGRPASMFVPAEDFVVTYSTSDLSSCHRATHIMRRTKNEVKKLQVAGIYLDDDLGDPKPNATGTDQVKEQYDKLQGFSPVGAQDKRYTILEMHVDVDLKGFEDVDQDGTNTGIELPYVVTVDKDSKKILSIRRNFRADDPLKLKRNHFIHYKYTPGLGFYGFGLIHLIGGIAKSATSILRQLVDAGTLSNMPGGFKARGLRIKSDDTPISPGEWRDIDVPGQAIKDNIMPLPYKEPSLVLSTLLGNIVEEGRRFASIADLDVGEGNQQAPVGTTLALLERSMKVMSAIHARLHASQSDEFDLLSDLIEEYTPDVYEYDVPGGRQVKKSDFNDRIDIVPVSDPNATSFAQRIMTQQLALQIAGSAPQLYDMRVLHRKIMGTIGIDDVDKVIPDPTQVPPLDPLSENAAAIMGQPIKAFEYQNHDAHLLAHQGLLQDPTMAQNPNAQHMAMIMGSHIGEHMAYKYRQQIAQTMGVQLPPMGQPMSPQIESQLAPMIAHATQIVTGQHQQLAAAQAHAQAMQNPEYQLKQAEVAIKARDVARKEKETETKARVDLSKTFMRHQGEEDRLANQRAIAAEKGQTQERIAGEKLAGHMVAEHLKHQAHFVVETEKNKVAKEIADRKVQVDLIKPTLRAPQAKPKQ